MRIIIDEQCGFCFGVKRAVDSAFSALSEVKNNGIEKIYCLGELIHNNKVIDDLKDRGMVFVDALEEVPCGATVLFRSHGQAPCAYELAKNKGLNVLDNTCVFVKKIHNIVATYFKLGYQIVVYGKAEHAETVGINGYCDNNAIIVDDNTDINSLLKELENTNKICIVSQTTMNNKKYLQLIENFLKNNTKTIEYFNTICYTTSVRQDNALKLSSVCDLVLVVGSTASSNTQKLYDICVTNCKAVAFVETVEDINKINFSTTAVVGITAGASTPYELILEVVNQMSKGFSEASSAEFLSGIDSFVDYKIGKKIKGIVIKADNNGIQVDVGGKLDGLIKREDLEDSENEFDPTQYPRGSEIWAVIISKKDADTGCLLLSKKQFDTQKHAQKAVAKIRNEQKFEVVIDKEIKGGIVGKFENYEVFIPQSQIQEYFSQDNKQFIGQKLAVVAIEIDDKKRRIVASAKKIILEEKKEKESVFWTHVKPGMIVTGVVKRFVDFGAFISVDGIDCLAHNSDLSWKRVTRPQDILKLDEAYDFLVINMDKEKGRISLGYKQLQQDQFLQSVEKYQVGADATGKVVRIVPYGAFIELEKGVDGLVHVSEAGQGFIKNINDVLKVGQEVRVRILGMDPANKKINLSIKATQEPIIETEDKPHKKSHKNKTEQQDDSEWNEESQNNPFADLLKDMNFGKK